MDCNFVSYRGFIYTEMLFNYTRQGFVLDCWHEIMKKEQNLCIIACQSLSYSVVWTPIDIYYTCRLKIENIHTPIISPSLSSASPPSHYLPFLNTSLSFCLLLTHLTFIQHKTHTTAQNIHFAYKLTGTATHMLAKKHTTKCGFFFFLSIIFLNLSSAARLFVFPW